MGTPNTYLNSTTGYSIAAFNVLTTELNAVTSGNLATLGANKTQTDTGSAIFADIWFKSGGAFTPTGAPNFSIWFIRSTDGGTTFELSTVAPPRQPDAIIQLGTAAYASGNIVYTVGVRLPAQNFKVLLQNNSGVTLPATTNVLTIGAFQSQF